MSPEARKGRPPGSRNKSSTPEHGVSGESRSTIFSDTLAHKIYDLTQRYPGSTLLGDLRLAPPTMRWQDFRHNGFSFITYPPDSWGPFYLSRDENFGLNAKERKNFSYALKIAMETGFSSIQQIREASVETLQEGLPTGGLPQRLRKTKLSEEKATFLKKAFGPEVPPI